MSGEILDFNKAKRQGEGPRFGVDADDIRQRLHANPRAFVDWLFSGRALCARNEARIGSTSGEAGSSLSIQLAGADAGLWKDHATDEGGDLIALYRAWRGYTGHSDFQLSLKEIAHDFLGDPVEVEKSAWLPSPSEHIEAKKAKLGTQPRADMVELGAPVATYKYYDTRGNVTASVIRYEPDGTRESKTFRPFCFRTIEGVTKWVPGAPDLRPLYLLPEISIASTVVLVEGEGCADALTKLGIPATSAMQGAHAPIDKTDWSPLAGKTVIIWPDNDAPGLAYAKAASERLLSLGCTVLGITPPSDKPAKWDASDCVAEGSDPQTLISAAHPVKAPPRPRVQLLSVSELAHLPPPAWLIDGVITVNGLSMLWGRSGSLKSFVALDMSLCIATGTQWHAHPVKKGRVVYLAAEGARGLGSRAMGWLKTRGRDLPEPDFQIIPHGLTMVSPGDLDALLDALDYANRPVTLFVIDTLSRTFGTGNPNQPADMNAFVGACERLREATGAHLMIVHHGGKDTDKNELGNEGLRNASDQVIYIRRKTDTVELINEAPKGKQKDFDEFKTIHLTPVKVHFEQNKTEQSTLILNLAETPSTPEGEGGDKRSEERLGKNEQAIVDALEQARGPLGFTRLAAMTRMNKGSLTRSLSNLIEKDLVVLTEGPTNQWQLK